MWSVGAASHGSPGVPHLAAPTCGRPLVASDGGGTARGRSYDPCRPPSSRLWCTILICGGWEGCREQESQGSQRIGGDATVRGMCGSPEAGWQRVKAGGLRDAPAAAKALLLCNKANQAKAKQARLCTGGRQTKPCAVWAHRRPTLKRLPPRSLLPKHSSSDGSRRWGALAASRLPLRYVPCCEPRSVTW